jgi:hypothetical protein
MYGKDNKGFTIETCYLSGLLHGMPGFRLPKSPDRIGQKFFEMIWGLQYKKQNI